MLTSKKLKEAWKNKIFLLMEELNAQDVTPGVQADYAKVWNILTHVGILQVTFFHSDNFLNELTVYAKWLDVKKALGWGIDCNPYNGKWNFHFSQKGKMNNNEKIQFMDKAINQVRNKILNYTSYSVCNTLTK
jgi:hypothetical protein